MVLTNRQMRTNRLVLMMDIMVNCPTSVKVQLTWSDDYILIWFGHDFFVLMSLDPSNSPNPNNVKFKNARQGKALSFVKLEPKNIWHFISSMT